MTLECITANLDFVTNPTKDLLHIDHLARLHPHIDNKILFAQEAKNLRGYNSLEKLGERLKDTSPVFDRAYQNISSASKAGTGFIAWGDTPIKGFHLWSLGASGATLIRWTAHGWTPVPLLPTKENDKDGHLTIFSPHDFPHRAGPAAQERYLRLMKKQTDHVHKKGNAWAVGTDANMPLSRVAKYLNGKQYGDGHDGIVGFITSLNVEVSRHGVNDYGVKHKFTDHPAVFIDIEGINR